MFDFVALFAPNPHGTFKKGTHFALDSVIYYDIDTPNIQDMLNDGGVIIPRSYAGGPKCSPSRFSVLTGRYPSRGDFAVRSAMKMATWDIGTTVSVPTTAIYGDDKVYNVYRTLKEDAANPYFTGMVGKWCVCLAQMCSTWA